MAKYLKFSPDLKLPADAVTRQVAILGRTGSGKSYGAGVLVECLHRNGSQVCVLDAVGNWWGLRVGKDGGDGLDIFVFGGIHGDVPIEPEAGALIANLVVERGISAVIDVSHMRKSQQRRFVTAFAEELFEAKKRHRSTALHLVIEEAQRFIPQKVGRGDEAMLGAFEDLAKIGRNFGIGWTIITQRPQSVNKDVLNQAEPLIVLQLTAAHERKAVRDWVDEHGVEVDEMFRRISKLQTGQAFVWSPTWLGKFVEVSIGEKQTYDASATPTGRGARRAPKPLSKRDIERLGSDMARVQEEAAAKDPKRLRAKVAKLERELTAAKQATPETKIEVERISVPVIEPKVLRRLEAVAEKLESVSPIETSAKELAATLRQVMQLVDVAIEASQERSQALLQSRPTRTPSPRKPPKSQSSPDAPRLRKGAVRMLQALATMNQPLTRGQLGMLVGMSTRGGTFRTYLGELRRDGLIEQDTDWVEITESGVHYLNGDFGDTPRTVTEVANLFRPSLRSGAWAMLEWLLERPGQRVPREALAEAVGMSPDGGTFRTYLGDIKRTGIVDVSRQDLGISDSIKKVVR